MYFSARHIVNSITLYRLVAAPVLLALALTNSMDIFKWMIAVSFFTDAIDGWLARKFKVTSILGARLDSIGDDLTVFAGILAIILQKPEFLRSQAGSIALLIILFLVQTIAALVRYRKTTSFHTYLAKAAAIFQGVFLILFFFLPHPLYSVFYAAVIITALELIEETIMVILLPEWRANVKGVFWIAKSKTAF